MPEINYLAVIVAAIVAMVVGGIWYGPLFGKLWMQGMGWDSSNLELMASKKKMAGPAYAQQFVGALLTSFVFAHVLWAFHHAMPDTTGISAGLQGAFWVWLGFVLPVKYGDKLWSGQKFKFVAIDLGYYLILLMVLGIILSSWTK